MTLADLLWAITLAFAVFGGLACSPGSTGASGGGAHANPGDTVGTFELGTPSIQNFTLHGTLPVPAHTYPRDDGLVPFQVKDSDGTLVTAQVEIVSRYARESDGADVLEVIAPVHVPSGANPGDRIQYDVVFQPSIPVPIQLDPDVANLVATPGSIVLRAHDVFQNAYTYDLLTDYRDHGPSMRRLKAGAYEAQITTHGSLLPVIPTSGPSGTLPHLMGVHAYLAEWANEPIVTLDLRIHNAHSGLSHTDPNDDALGQLYFDTLEIAVPAGWNLYNTVPDPYWGPMYPDGGSNVWPLVAPIASGKLHVMPAMSQFERRLVLVRQGYDQRAASWLNEEGIAFCKKGISPTGADLWSWWNPYTSRYFPQRHELPTLDHVGLQNLRNADRADFEGRALQIESGAPGWWPAECPGLGWAQPWGVTSGGMVSGAEIYLYDGVKTACAASNAGYRLAQLVHRMLTDRQPNVLFDLDGRPTHLEEWLVQGPEGPELPIWWFGGPLLWASDPFGITTSPSFQRDAVAAQGLQPDWESTLLSYQYIDEEHLIRYTRLAKVLAWLGNDALAKDDLRAQAEGIRFTYSMYRQNQWPQGVIVTGMLAARTYVDAHPGWGFGFGRAQAWGLDAMCAYYSLADLGWRENTEPWFGLVADLVRDGQMDCTGIIQAGAMINVFNGQYRCRQSIEAAITENALVGMRESVFRGVQASKVSEVNAILALSLYAMISPLVWDPTIHGPWAMIADGPIDADLPPFCTYWPRDGNYGIGDFYQIWSSFAYAYEITHNPVFLTRAVEALGGWSDLKSLLLAGGADNVENRAALLQLAESL